MDGNKEVEHCFSATDLNRGAPVFFTTTDGGKLYSEALQKWTRFPVYEKLHEVVRASAAFPGGFPPKQLYISSFRKGGVLGSLFSKDTPSTLYLADGGVWNNLGTDLWADERTWWRGSGTLSKAAYTQKQRLAISPALRLVVNSGAPLNLRPTRYFIIPILAEVTALVRSMETLYQNTVAPRVRQMQLRAKMPKSIADQLSGPPQTVVVDVSQEPVQWVWSGERDYPDTEDEVAQRHDRGWNFLFELLKTFTPEVQEKFRILLEARNSKGTESWEGIFELITSKLSKLLKLDATEIARSVPTTLNKIDARSAAALLTHGYVSTMAGMHTLYGEPLLKVPGTNELADRVQLDKVDLPLDVVDKSDLIELFKRLSITKNTDGGLSISLVGGDNP